MVTIIGGFIIPAALPMLLVAWLWLSYFRSRTSWALALLGATVALALLFWVCRWDVIGVHWRYSVFFIWIGCLASYIRVRRLPWTSSLNDQPTWSWAFAYLVPNFILLGLFGWMIFGMNTPADSVRISSPFADGDYYVLHGGRSPLLNYHGAFDDAHTHALDIVRLHPDRRRARGILPADLQAYAIFQDIVHAPLGGIIVATENALPDKSPSNRDRENPLGNHIIIQQDSIFVVLAHFEQGSVRVKTGDPVSVGDHLGRVGNSGSSSEPHLHIHAIRYDGPMPASPATFLKHGKPLPLRIEGRYLMRNSRF